MALLDWIKVYLKGFAMGAADAVPGVSGGTIALIAGIYDRLVGAIAALNLEDSVALLKNLLRPHDPAARKSALRSASGMDLPFLLILAVGVVSAALTAANVIEWAVGAHAGPTYAFFFGLIVASVIVLRGELSLGSAAGWAAAVTGFVLAFYVSGLSNGGIGSSPLILFFAGMIGISAMVLPGISGSLILLTLGQYETIITAVHDLTQAVFALTLDAAIAPFLSLAIFTIGALIGILSFARIVAWALANHRLQTMTFLVALMVGALRAPADRVMEATPEWTPFVTVVLLAWGILGAIAVLGLDAFTEEITY
ncbi:DUF368 domain-containing protein [Halodesulfurarchaeum sp.]|uniref:DUF368 domain-containing protein n=1 Tax=Halodesulfurarchaeum sp. TaxID=1980530 RepID=UPI002FC38BA3